MRVSCRRNRCGPVCVLLCTGIWNKKGLVHAIFLAVSAFCNAGIDLFGETSLSVYVSNPLVNITTIGLIIVSGLGFIVWWDLWDKFRKVLRKELSPSRVFVYCGFRASWSLR